MIVLEGRGLGRPPFLSQAAPSQGATLESFYSRVNALYDALETALSLAQSGETERSKLFLKGAKGLNDAAFSDLKALRDAKALSPDEVSDLNFSVMKPLGDAIGGVDEAIVKGGDFLLRFIDGYKRTVLSIVSKLTGFAGKRWEKIVFAYKSIVDLNKGGRKALGELSLLPQSPELAKAIEGVKASLLRTEAAQRQFEAVIKRRGIPLEAVQKGLSGVPILAVKLFVIGTAVVTVGTVVKIALAAIGTLVGGFIAFFGFELGGWIAYGSRARQELEALERQQKFLEEREKIRRAKELGDAEKKANIALDEVGRTLGIIDGMRDQGLVSPQDAERARKSAEKAGVTPPKGVPALLIIGGAGLALGLLFVFLRKR